MPYLPNSNTEDILQTLKSQNNNFIKSATNFKDEFIDTLKISNFSNLPPIFNEMLFSDSIQKENAHKKIIDSILTTFGEKNIYSLRRNNGKLNTLSIEFGYSEQNNVIWRAEIKGNRGNKAKTSFHASLLEDISVSRMVADRIERLLEQIKIVMELRYPQYRSMVRTIEMLSYPKTMKRSQVHYLPAVRGGIMQSHKFIASAGLDRLLNAGLEDTRVVPRLPKISIDFIKKILSISANTSGTDQVLTNRMSNSHDAISLVADRFEELVLDGRIESHTEFAESYPEIYFESNRNNKKFALSRSSSMVSELAPIVLFIRYFLRRHDLLILEEPEAHLHPGAQVKIAQCLALLVRKGVNVIVTTHSDWFLKCIQNLIIQGKLKQLNISYCADEADSYLHQNEVGAWNFAESVNSRGTKVREIVFREDIGIELEEIEDLTLSLYNDVIHSRNLIASKEFGGKESKDMPCHSDIEVIEMFTPRDIAMRLSVGVERIRRKLKQFGIAPVKGNRYFFDKHEFDNLCERMTDEFKADAVIR